MRHADALGTGESGKHFRVTGVGDASQTQRLLVDRRGGNRSDTSRHGGGGSFLDVSVSCLAASGLNFARSYSAAVNCAAIYYSGYRNLSAAFPFRQRHNCAGYGYAALCRDTTQNSGIAKHKRHTFTQDPPLFEDVQTQFRPDARRIAHRYSYDRLHVHTERYKMRDSVKRGT